MPRGIRNTKATVYDRESVKRKGPSDSMELLRWIREELDHTEFTTEEILTEKTSSEGLESAIHQQLAYLKRSGYIQREGQHWFVTEAGMDA